MTSVYQASLLALTVLIAGCSYAPPPMPTSADMSGTALLADGSKVKNVLVIFQPMETGHPSEAEVDDKGQFTVHIVPAKFMFYFAPSKKSKSQEGMKNIPTSYQSPNVDHFVDAKAGGTLTITVN